MKKVSAGAILGLLLLASTGGVAFAGEVTGNGKQTPIAGHRAASECAFSGLEDGDGNPPGPGHVQTPAEVAGTGIPGKGALIEVAPGVFFFVSCNPTAEPDPA